MNIACNKLGFTMLELTVSVAILGVLGSLGLATLLSSTSIVGVSDAKETAQASLRDTLTTMTRELQLAAKRSNPALVPPLQGLTVVSPTEIRFQVPANNFGTAWSLPITYRLINEDTDPGNARLDGDEDTNNDHALTRRIVRIQGDGMRPLAPANDIANVAFALDGTGSVLTIQLTATKAVGSRRHDIVHATATSQVYLQN